MYTYIYIYIYICILLSSASVINTIIIIIVIIIISMTVSCSFIGVTMIRTTISGSSVGAIIVISVTYATTIYTPPPINVYSVNQTNVTYYN